MVEFREMMRLNKVKACADARNVASIRLLEKLGFHQDGVLRENTYFTAKSHGTFMNIQDLFLRGGQIVLLSPQVSLFNWAP